jgi:pimeloyl-ACP methyl ester carboxylesterase
LPELLALNEPETANWLEMRARYPLFLYKAPWESIDSVLAFRPVDVLHHSQCPVRFIHGADDPLVSSDHSAVMRDRAGSRADLQLITGADHALPIGPYKQRTQDLVIEWLDYYLK